jgi:Lrp/AsnC family transcriptional regulator
MLDDLDLFDRRILQALQEDASISTTELAERIGLSQSPCWRRLQRLKQDGYIKGQVVLLDREKIGLKVQIYALIKLTAHGRANVAQFAQAARAHPEVLECHITLGATDCLLRIVASNMQAYEQFFFEKLSVLPGVQEVNSLVSLSEIKSTTVLPLGAPAV